MIKLLFASALTLILACNSKEANRKDAQDYLYKMEGSAGVSFSRENKDTIFSVIKLGSQVGYRCIDNGYLYVYTTELIRNNLKDTLVTNYDVKNNEWLVQEVTIGDTTTHKPIKVE